MTNNMVILIMRVDVACSDLNFRDMLDVPFDLSVINSSHLEFTFLRNILFSVFLFFFLSKSIIRYGWYQLNWTQAPFFLYYSFKVTSNFEAT